MANRVKYDLNAEWDDPCEHIEENRKRVRCVERISIKIAVHVANHAELLVGSGTVHNISQSGLLCHTKHHLTANQDVQISIHTEGYTGSQPLPHKFVGTAKSIRVNTLEEGVQEVALEFGNDLSGNMSFAIFIENLRTSAGMKAAH